MQTDRHSHSGALIGLDGYNLALEQGTGVATYARNLSYALKALGAEVDVVYGRNVPGGNADAFVREMGFFDSLPDLSLKSIPAAVAGAVRALAPLRAVDIPISGRVLVEDFQARMPAFDRLWNVRNLFALAHAHFDVWGAPLRIRLPHPPAVMHWTYPVPVELVGAKNIYTLHDLVPLRLPHTTLDHKRRYLKLMRWIARRADHIVTVSQASRADITALLDLPDERITNTYQAVDFPPDALIPEAEARAQIAGAFGLPYKGYFLFFGAIEPKKNINRLIQGFLASDAASPLLIVGKRAWKSDQELMLMELAERRPEALDEPLAPADRFAPHGSGAAGAKRDNRRIIHVDYAPLSLLLTLIRGARAVVFPSLYEGFGLPVLEAMQLGTPVITSTAASLPEVAGDAALLVDPYRPSAIGEAIRALEGDADLRAALAEKGLRQAALFSREAYERRLRGLYAGLGVAL